MIFFHLRTATELLTFCIDLFPLASGLGCRMFLIFTSLTLFFGLIMRCRHVDGSWEYLVFDFWFYVSEICHFICSSSMRFFCGTSFFIFQDSVWLVESSWRFHCCSINQIYWSCDCFRAVGRCGVFLSEKWFSCYKFFYFLGQCLAKKVILICSLLFISAIY